MTTVTVYNKGYAADDIYVCCNPFCQHYFYNKEMVVLKEEEDEENTQHLGCPYCKVLKYGIARYPKKYFDEHEKESLDDFLGN